MNESRPRTNRLRDLPLEAEKPDTESAGRKGVGGTYTHKSDCHCRPCKARRRAAQAILGGLRDGGEDLDTQTEIAAEVIDVDAGTLVTPPLGHGGKPSPKARIIQWLNMRAGEPNITMGEAASRLGVNPNTLRRDIQQAAREGWLRFEDPVERLDNEIIPIVLDNLRKFALEGDKTVTIETAKGTIYPVYREVKGATSRETTVLALKLEMPEGNGEIRVAGTVIGKARELVDDDAV